VTEKRCVIIMVRSGAIPYQTGEEEEDWCYTAADEFNNKAFTFVLYILHST
jgi:hypothetical protein